jgi:hypothetical protein
MGRLSLLILGLALALPSAAPAASTLLQNGRFTEAAGGLPAGWRVEAWARDLTDVTWEPSADGPGDGSGMARIVNRAANDARLCQTIPVRPGASYRVSARVKTQDVGLTTAGALIAIEPRIADSVDLKGTQDWQTLEVTVANPDASTWDVCLRLGSYANLNTGTAWFTDVRVDLLSGGVPTTGSRWPSLTLAPLLASLRQTPWMQTAVPLVGGFLLALGLGIVGRRPG